MYINYLLEISLCLSRAKVILFCLDVWGQAQQRRHEIEMHYCFTTEIGRVILPPYLVDSQDTLPPVIPAMEVIP